MRPEKRVRLSAVLRQVEFESTMEVPNSETVSGLWPSCATRDVRSFLALAGGRHSARSRLRVSMLVLVRGQGEGSTF